MPNYGKADDYDDDGDEGDDDFQACVSSGQSRGGLIG